MESRASEAHPEMLLAQRECGLWLESHSRRLAQQGWRERNRDLFRGMGVLMHRRCVLVSLCPSDGRHGHRVSAQGAVLFGSGLAVGPCRMCRGMRFDAEEGESGEGIGALWSVRWLPCGGVQTISGPVEWLRMRSGRNWTTGGGGRRSELEWTAGVEHPTSPGQGAGVDLRVKGC